MVSLLVVEDDEDAAHRLGSSLQRWIPDCQVEYCYSESELLQMAQRTKFPSRPDLAIVDVMLRWDKPSRAPTPRPQVVKDEGFFRAGLRCINYIRAAWGLEFPVVVWTALSERDLPAFSEGPTVYAHKGRTNAVGSAARGLLVGLGRELPAAQDEPPNAAGQSTSVTVHRGAHVGILQVGQDQSVERSDPTEILQLLQAWFSLVRSSDIAVDPDTARAIEVLQEEASAATITKQAIPRIRAAVSAVTKSAATRAGAEVILTGGEKLLELL